MVAVGDKIQVVTDLSGRRSIVPYPASLATSLWQQATGTPGWGLRWYHSGVLLANGDILVIGGVVVSSTIPVNDVWKSSDGGVTWTQIKVNTMGQITTVTLASGGDGYRDSTQYAYVIEGSISSGTISYTTGNDGVVTPAITLINPGYNYTPGTYPLYTSFDATYGHIATVTKTNSGTGYHIGDIITLVQTAGAGATIRVDTLSGSAVATYTILTTGWGYSTGSKSTTVSPAGGSGCVIRVDTITPLTPATVTITVDEVASQWKPRLGHRCVVMPDDSIVLMGGGGILSEYYNDTWRSVDGGVSWTEQSATAGWSARYGFGAVVLPATITAPNGTIVLMGGYTGSWRQEDVWSSTDYGVTWTQTCIAGIGGARNEFGYGVMPNGDILIFGGYTTGGPSSDVWKSSDGGATWSSVTAAAPWLRYAHSVVISPSGVISLVGGLNRSYVYNDEWESTDGITWLQKKTNDALNGFAARYNFALIKTTAGKLVLMGGEADISTGLGDVWYKSP